MNTDRVLDELIALLDAHGVRVREEALIESAGGLCSMNGKNILFLDRSSAIETRIELCARAVIKLIDLDSVYLKPGVRELLEAVREKPSAAPYQTLS
jgi:hypothetical protein